MAKQHKVKSIPHIIAGETQGDLSHWKSVGSGKGLERQMEFRLLRGKQTESVLAPDDRVGTGLTNSAKEGF